MSIRIPLAAAGLLCACLLFTVSARASYDPLASGATTIALDKGFARLLAAKGVRVSTAAGAKRHGRSLTLPVVGGKLDPVSERGEVESEGTLILSHGARSVRLGEVVVRTSHEPLVAKVGGSRLKLASAPRLSFRRAGFGSTLSASSLQLSAKLATRLGKKLHLRGVFAEGQRLGSLRCEALPLTLAVLPVGRATLTPAPEFLAKLESLFVSLNPVAPAERAPGPLFTVPLIAEGTIAPDAASGVPRSGGALEFLQLGSGQVFWQELWFDLAGRQLLADVDVEPSPTLPGKVGQVPVAALGQGAVSSDPAARTVGVSGAPLALSAQAAGYFNQAFAGGEAEFQAGESIGALTFTAQAQ